MQSEIRLLYVMQRLSEYALTNGQLAEEIYGENSDKTRANIRNSIKILKKHFGSRLVEVSKGTHKLIDLPHVFGKINSRSTEEMLGLFEFVSLFDSSKLALFEQSEPALVAKIKRETAQLYHLFDPPYEKIGNTTQWQEIKKAIRKKRYLTIHYQKNKPKTYRMVKPIRIVYAQNNWYLAVLLTEEKEGYDFTFLRINNIENISLSPKTFHIEVSANRHLEKMQSLFESYGQPPHEVVLHVPATIASYFKHKQFLSSQCIVEEKDDGALLISYHINNDMAILPLIKQWIPHIRVIKPQKLKDKLETLIRDYLETLSE